MTDYRASYPGTGLRLFGPSNLKDTVSRNGLTIRCSGNCGNGNIDSGSFGSVPAQGRDETLPQER